MSTGKVTYEFDPFELVGVDPPESQADRNSAMREIGEFIVNEVRSYCADASSPVSGGSWKATLSKEYAKRKVAAGGDPIANLELTGELMDAVSFEVTDDTTMEFGVWGAQAAKADGHNNFSGASELPLREFVPKEGGTFKRDILSGIRLIAEQYTPEGGDNGG